MSESSKVSTVDWPCGCRISRVDCASLAQQAGMRPGDYLVALNGHPVEDIIDYWYHSSAERLKLVWREGGPQGELRSKTVRKAFHERLGVEVEPFEMRKCTNACLFCFVHQLPRGVRRELYVKDEDYRLSFLHGNYITGTNLSPADVRRIQRLKLSPLYFSVHATDPAVRQQLLGRHDIEPIFPLLRKLAKAGIFLHAQIVLCPGINDKAVLQQTVSQLAQLYPKLESIAVVPVGLTSHREHLPKLEPVTPDYARRFLHECSRLQRRMSRTLGSPLLFPSDEFFLLAELEPPSYAHYPEIPQLANGVGVYYRFYESAQETLEALPRRLDSPRRIAAVTSPLGEKVLRRLVESLNATVANLEVKLIVSANSLFGEGVTVSGLLPGADFLKAIESHPRFDRYLLPANALRPWDLRFLDDLTLSELKQRTGAEIALAEDTAESFVRAALNPIETLCPESACA